MQSFRQYRKFGKLIQEQLDRDLAKHENLGDKSSDDPSTGGPGDTHVGDLEKGPASPPATQAAYPLEFADEPEDRGRKLSKDDAGINGGDDEPKEEAESPTEEQEDPDHGAHKETEPIRRGPRSSSRTSSRARRVLTRMSSTMTNQSFGTGLGLRLSGINVRDRTAQEGGDSSKQVFVVDWHDENDPMNPHNWSNWTRIGATLNVASIGAVVGFASSIDSSALMQAAADFDVSPVVESLATGLYLAGFGAGALVSGPFSETIGRNPVYIITLSLYMIFIMASGLAPNIGAQLTFRFFAGFFGATPLTCAGGSIADLWNPLERVWAFSIFANNAFFGPILGPVVGGFVASSPLISWRWTEWVTLIISGLVLFNVTFFQPETFSGVILMWKAKHLRQLTGDDRYAAPMEIRADTFSHRLKIALYRPFVLTAQEPIIILITLYLTVIYIILFTFLDGYNYIFAEIHGTSQGITGLCFMGIGVGLYCASAQVPLIYKWAKRDLKKIREAGGTNLPPEFRLWFSMLGASVGLPVSLFWMGWSSRPDISIWSPLIASVLFGYSVLCIFISSYSYVIDSYEIYSASALASVTLIRYVVSGGMVVVGIPFYENMGVPVTLSILGGISALLAPLPYVFYIYGHRIRAHSKYAVTFKD